METKTVEYIEHAKLDWPDLWRELGMERDRAGRWMPGEDTPQSVVEYLQGYRSPSRAWPQSYAKALLTRKFARHLVENESELAVRCCVARVS